MKCPTTMVRLLAPVLTIALVLAASTSLHADELSDAVTAAEKAADKAEKAASMAMSAASAARAAGDATKAAAAAMDAGSAARDAAQAVRDLAKVASSASMSASSAGAAAEPKSAQSTETSVAASSSSGSTKVAVASSDGGAKAYADHVQCEGKSCKIDLFLTKGFRAFSQCQVCHGLDANGSSFAPSLVAKLQEIDKARFVDVVANGYKGQVGVMPPWKSNPNVMKVMDNLYAYLLARSDKVVPPGKLKRYDR